jgi:uncharacterized protein YajQ (UPF0234 family)
VTITNGISQENAKKISKLIRDKGPKSVKAQIQGEELRVSSKSRDDLQEVQRLIRDEDFDFAVQFVNYRLCRLYPKSRYVLVLDSRS